MVRRKEVFTKVVDQCAAGLKDAVSGKPHRKSTAFQANHPSVLKWRNLSCPHQPGEHQPIEGNVYVENGNGDLVSVKAVDFDRRMDGGTLPVVVFLGDYERVDTRTHARRVLPPL